LSILARESVQRVRDALAQAGSTAEIIELTDTARTAHDAASSLGCSLGAIVKSLAFQCGDEVVMALVSGDRQCLPEELRAVLGRTGDIRIAKADLVRDATGFAIGGVAPVGHSTRIAMAIDESLRRFDTVYAAAGHPHCVFATSADELVTITGARIAAGISR
jgi:prolyl-tRNA editing enzyme YbaK/EbsC (Cys-tRNA(Pro) deacylase)